MVLRIQARGDTERVLVDRVVSRPSLARGRVTAAARASAGGAAGASGAAAVVGSVGAAGAVAGAAGAAKAAVDKGTGTHRRRVVIGVAPSDPASTTRSTGIPAQPPPPPLPSILDRPKSA